jgi:hypothetical protein
MGQIQFDHSLGETHGLQNPPAQLWFQRYGRLVGSTICGKARSFEVGTHRPCQSQRWAYNPRPQPSFDRPDPNKKCGGAE